MSVAFTKQINPDLIYDAIKALYPDAEVKAVGYFKDSGNKIICRQAEGAVVAGLSGYIVTSGITPDTNPTDVEFTTIINAQTTDTFRESYVKVYRSSNFPP